MNEILLIRNQLAAERTHATAVVAACGQSLSREAPALRRACTDYLARVLASFEERDRRLTALCAQRPDEDPLLRALREAPAATGAVQRLHSALGGEPAADAAGAATRWREFARYFAAVWSVRRNVIEALLAPNTRVADWRALAGIDADSILEERDLYARVCAALPPGVELAEAEG